MSSQPNLESWAGNQISKSSFKPKGSTPSPGGARLDAGNSFYMNVYVSRLLTGQYRRLETAVTFEYCNELYDITVLLWWLMESKYIQSRKHYSLNYRSPAPRKPYIYSIISRALTAASYSYMIASSSYLWSKQPQKRNLVFHLS